MRSGPTLFIDRQLPVGRGLIGNPVRRPDQDTKKKRACDTEPARQKAVLSLRSRRPEVHTNGCLNATKVGDPQIECLRGLMTFKTTTTSLAHEISQSIAGMLCNAQAALHWLEACPPNLHEARIALGGIARCGEHAGDIITSIRRFVKSEPSQEGSFEVSKAVLDPIAVVRTDMVSQGIALFPAKRVGKTGAVARDVRRDQLAAHGPFGRQKLQRIRLQNFIESRLDDPDLSVDRIARACNMSVRSVHRAFAMDEHGSVSRYIWMRRLCQCAADLRDPRQANRPITEICYSWGFNSTSHFCRLFKEQFGVTPRDYKGAFGQSGEPRRMVPIEQKQAVSPRSFTPRCRQPNGYLVIASGRQLRGKFDPNPRGKPG